MIDLRSDTITRPCIGMRQAMANAEMGDDCYGEDRTVKLLEEKCSEILQKEAALFMPTGTMSNQVAIKAHTKNGDEVFTHARYHVYYYEAAPSSAFSGVHFGTISHDSGAVKPEDLSHLMQAKPRGQLYAQPTLLVLENSVCSLGGKAFTASELTRTKKRANDLGLRVHLDGARLLNACVSTGSKLKDFSQASNSVSICFAKGLGAPMGSVLCGTHEFIEKAKVYRKWFGGALHQSGIIAAACLFGLDEVGFTQIQKDHANAQKVYQDLCRYFAKDTIEFHKSNMILVSCKKAGAQTHEVVRALKEIEILVLPWDGHSIRLVFHRGVEDKLIKGLGARLAKAIWLLSKRDFREKQHETTLQVVG